MAKPLSDEAVAAIHFRRTARGLRERAQMSTDEAAACITTAEALEAKLSEEERAAVVATFGASNQ